MKTNKTNFDVDKRDFYNKVRERKDELSAVLYAANLEGYGFKDFNEWYTQEYDWRFLRDILGERDKKGNPWDYNTLVHLPVWTWTDAEGTEHRQVIKGEVKPDDLGLGITSMTAGDGIKIEETADSDEHITFTVSDNMVDSDTIEVSRDNDGTLLVPNYVTRVNVKEGLYSKVTPSTSAAQDVDTIQSVEIDGTKYNFPGSSGSLVTKTYVDQQDAAVLSNAKDYTDAEKMVPSETMFEGATAPLGFIIGETQYNFPSGTPEAYVKSASVEDATLTLTDQDDKKVTFTKPTKTSELTNDGDTGSNKFLTEHQSLDNYYTKDETYSSTEIDQKIATGTGLYLGWLENDAEDLPSESEIGTWIIANWSSLQPESVEQVTNNDYVFVWFSTQYIYWRVKVVTEETGKVLPSAVSWKKDLEFNDDIIGLIDQVEKNTTDIDDLKNEKVDKITTTGYGAYGHSDGAEKDWAVSANADEKTLAYRTTGGVLRVGTPTEDDNATTKKYVDEQVSNCEKTANKVTSLSSESTDTQYPTAKCVYDLVGNIETILTTLNTGTGAK